MLTTYPRDLANTMSLRTEHLPTGEIRQ